MGDAGVVQRYIGRVVRSRGEVRVNVHPPARGGRYLGVTGCRGQRLKSQAEATFAGQGWAGRASKAGVTACTACVKRTDYTQIQRTWLMAVPWNHNGRGERGDLVTGSVRSRTYVQPYLCFSAPQGFARRWSSRPAAVTASAQAYCVEREMDRRGGASHLCACGCGAVTLSVTQKTPAAGRSAGGE